MWSAGQGDDKERFLADLRALRDKATLEFDELAARAHYPSDILKEAESGPSLPGLPILAAYVRACDGDVPEWEERWRRLGFEAGADPGLPVRPAGASPAAVAGARAGVSVAPPDAYDPDRIRAALRGSHVRADKAAQASAGQHTLSPAGSGHDGAGTATARSSTAHESQGSREGWGAGPGVAETTRWDGGAAAGDADAGGADAGWDGAAARGADAGQDAGSRWDARPNWDPGAHQGGTTTNGNHHVWLREDAPGGAFTETPDAADTADALRRDPFSSSWLDDSQPIPPVPDAGTGRPATEDAEQAPPEWTGFWTPAKTAAAPADVQQPTAPPPADEPAGAETSWSAFTPSSPRIAAEPVRRADPDLAARGEPTAAPAAPAATGAGAATAATAASARPQAAGRPEVPQPAGRPEVPQPAGRPEVPQPAPASPSESRPDRYYPLRLLAVIVVAALIGSVLVMILR